MTPTPRAELAAAIHRKTRGGDSIVDFLTDVLDENIPDVRLTHRLQSARLLTKHGHFPKADRFIQQHKQTRKRAKSRSERKQDSEFDAALQNVTLAEAGPAFVAQWLIDVMQGRTPAIELGLDTFKPHHRMSAVRELLARGYDRDYTFTTEAASVPTPVATHTPETREQEPMPADNPQPTTVGAELTTDNYELTTDDSEEYDPEKDPLIIELDRLIASIDPKDLVHPPTPYKPDLSMWKIIEKIPVPYLGPEVHKIGAAKLDAMLERHEISRKAALAEARADSKKEDNINYDDS